MESYNFIIGINNENKDFPYIFQVNNTHRAYNHRLAAVLSFFKHLIHLIVTMIQWDRYAFIIMIPVLHK